MVNERWMVDEMRWEMKRSFFNFIIFLINFNKLAISKEICSSKIHSHLKLYFTLFCDFDDDMMEEGGKIDEFLIREEEEEEEERRSQSTNTISNKLKNMFSSSSSRTVSKENNSNSNNNLSSLQSSKLKREPDRFLKL